MKSPITTHVLDTVSGRPASNLAVVLEKETGGAWSQLAKGATNSDGRVEQLLAPGALTAGNYRLTFLTGEYFAREKAKTFYPQVCIHFEVASVGEHYHVPLLLSRYGYSTYRGS